MKIGLVWAGCVLFCGVALGQRLPGNVVPEHYSLKMSPEIATATFTGSETIDVVLAQPAKAVTLNAIELKIQSVTAGGQTAAITYDESKEQATFTFPRALPAGKATLAIAFSGILNDKLHGFYLSKTKARNYAVTQFESTDARRAFPCFDEPALKATFDVAVTVDARDTVISNSPMKSDTAGGGSVAGTGLTLRDQGSNGNGAGSAGGPKHTLVFDTTPRMSTYLVAFLVGDFQCTKGSSDGTPIRVCSTPDKVKQTTFALSAAEHFLKYYDTYFGIKYPMAKLDLIAIPDFEAGAMENFGAITYRETELLVDEADGPTGEKKHVASVVAHEMAHQWFGDMVTMQWWDNLWLNEGFANWMEKKAPNDWHPEWHFPQDAADELDGTLNSDSVKTTRTIRAKAETPSEISEMFDEITYNKAGAVIGMVENWLGPEVFRQGVHNYLAAHLYGNATAEDFWGAQTANAHQPVDKVMRGFVDYPGVPLLTFRDGKAGGFPVSEEKFHLDAPPAGDNAGAWVVPVCLKTSGTPVCRLLEPGAKELKGAEGAGLLYANAGAKGYYRVAYSPAEVKAITAVAGTALTVPERIGFLGDRWALTQAGTAPVGEYLDLAFALKADPNVQVLEETLGRISAIRTRIATPEDRVKLNAVVRREFGPIYAGLGKDGNGLAGGTYDQQQMRAELFGALGQADDPVVLAHAKQLTDSLFAGEKVTEPNILDVSVALSAGKGDQAFYDRIVYVEQKSADADFQAEMLQILTEFRDPALVVKTLEFATSGQVRNQDSWTVIAAELARRDTSDVAWPWVQAHWAQVQAQLTRSSGGRVVESTGAFCSVKRRDEVAAFFAEHKVEAADRPLAKALASIDACVRLQSAQEPKLKEWLAVHAP